MTSSKLGDTAALFNAQSATATVLRIPCQSSSIRQYQACICMRSLLSVVIQDTRRDRELRLRPDICQTLRREETKTPLASFCPCLEDS